MIQHHTQWCSSDSALATAKECESARAALDPSAPAVKSEELGNAPKGCSRWDGKWFFNTHAEGKLDGESEPVCKTAAGKANRILRGRFLYVLYMNTFFCMHSSCPNYH